MLQIRIPFGEPLYSGTMGKTFETMAALLRPLLRPSLQSTLSFACIGRYFFLASVVFFLRAQMMKEILQQDEA